jgi:3-isopropylmalate/(R)-2-methylmalate dehydratase small subunit
MRVWKLPADINTDQLAPSAATNSGIDITARRCLESLRPGFANKMERGDVIVAGGNFGMGSSREEAAAVLVHLGIAAVIAPSFAGLYYRNAFNVGLLLLTCPQASLIEDGEPIEFDARACTVTRINAFPPYETLHCQPIPEFLLERIEAGGLLAQLKARRMQRAGHAA